MNRSLVGTTMLGTVLADGSGRTIYPAGW